MAAVLFMLYDADRNLRRERIFRDRSNPIDSWDDITIYERLRFRRVDILEIVDEIQEALTFANRGHNVTPTLQVCLALRFYATGTFQNVCADLAGVSQSMAGRIIDRVTRALLDRAHRWITFPNQQEADRQKAKFFNLGGFPDVVGCIDGTHVRIQAPWRNEHEYVCRKNYHSINVQVICNADLLFIDVVAKWPGSVHDARILRQSSIFAAFEGHPKPVDGVMLADSGYMSREWLMTPFLNPTTRHERRYNAAHASTRCTVERAIGM
ncbi:putative nuclease HARBI1 [Pomacea canaliculata]|uniref:putative nuclease HARBI1 n=1 Tax=Pomacea canaliculata TaxID=400727 RepID=UPI000D739873|nr:putative nuclease HARBI1 [Pomacea canaliculata]